MTIKYLIPSVAALSLLNSGCMTSEKWVDDDVYVMKSVELPTDTDVSDETDYSSFVFNQRHNRGRIDYYNSFNMTNRPMWASPGYIIGGTYYSPYYHMGLYDPCGYYSAFGYNYGYYPYYGYNPYMGYNHSYGWGWGNPGYGYGYGYNPYNYYGQNSGNSNWNNQPKPGIHVSGPRGAIAGYGGVRSNSPYAYKSAPVVNSGANPSGKPAIAQRQGTSQPVRTVSKPVASYDRVGKDVVTVRPASSGQTNGRIVTPTTQSSSGGQVYTSGRTSSPQVVRPASTTTRTENRQGSGTTYTSGRTSTTTRPVSTGTTSSPQRHDSGNGSSSGSSRVSTGNSSAGSSRSSSGSSSGSSSSPRSGSSSSGGSHSSGRRP